MTKEQIQIKINVLTTIAGTLGKALEAFSEECKKDTSWSNDTPVMRINTTMPLSKKAFFDCENSMPLDIGILMDIDALHNVQLFYNAVLSSAEYRIKYLKSELENLQK